MAETPRPVRVSISPLRKSPSSRPAKNYERWWITDTHPDSHSAQTHILRRTRTAADMSTANSLCGDPSVLVLRSPVAGADHLLQILPTCAISDMAFSIWRWPGELNCGQTGATHS